MRELRWRIRRLIGDAKFYADVGFEDWQKAIKDYRQSGQDSSVNSLLDQLENAVGHFIVMRQRFGPMNYQIAMQSAGQKYLYHSSMNFRT